MKMTRSLHSATTAFVPRRRTMPALRDLLRRLPAWAVNGLTVTFGLLLVQGSIWLVAGAHAAQIAIAMGVCASLADVVTTADRVARRVFAAIVLSSASAALFLVARAHEPMVLPTVVLVVFCAMLVQAWGPKAGTVSFATSMSLVFAMSTPSSQGLTVEYVGWGLLGAGGYWIWAVLTAHLLQPTWRRLALSTTVHDVAALLAVLAAQARSPADPLLQQQIVQLESGLADRMQAARDLIFGNSDGPEAHLQTSVLLRLADLRDLAVAGKVDTPVAKHGRAGEEERRLISEALSRMASMLDGIAEHVRSGRLKPVDADMESDVGKYLAELERQAGSGSIGVRRAVADVLQGQWAHVRAIHCMHGSSFRSLLPCRREDLRRYIAPDEWSLSGMRGALKRESPTFRYALRTALAAGLGYMAASLSPWVAHPQWVLLSVIVVMQGSLAQTLVRRNARVLGTLLGCLLVAVLTLSHAVAFLSLCFLVAGGVAHAYLGVRYSVTAAAAAVMAVLQGSLAAHGADFGILERLGDTVIGALIGWLASYALPTWERRRLAGDLRQALEAIRVYAAEALKPDEGSRGLPRHARQRAYDAIRAVAAARSRTLAEPSSVRLSDVELTLWLSAAYAIMSHLANARLSLTLYAKESGSPVLPDAVAGIASQLDQQLQRQRAERDVAPKPVDEHALNTVPELLPRLEDALAQADRLVAASHRLCQMVAPQQGTRSVQA